MLFLGEKGQAKSRLMRLMTSFLDDEIPYIDDPQIPVHDDPFGRSRDMAGNWCRAFRPTKFRSHGGRARALCRAAFARHEVR